ncbi:hypothetical protein [Roseomonas marmotae]|uniref:Uncharacterized protein n=1 Tax=Roseomonas marmotae TaxID=2768161 RepID=A0ABS3KAQ6_9PROT|nr:hypothetical protein [Roseomonas marmotae]MBO1074551.1 hypothetical protein [Roseomonas marmotae]QTI81584.1 hypothetical protein IAI58_19820 [Roseomonas marmotae]
MYLLIRKAKLAGSREEAARRARDHLLPLAQGRAGLRGEMAYETPAMEGGETIFLATS